MIGEDEEVPACRSEEAVKAAHHSAKIWENSSELLATGEMK